MLLFAVCVLFVRALVEPWRRPSSSTIWLSFQKICTRRLGRGHQTYTSVSALAAEFNGGLPEVLELANAVKGFSAQAPAIKNVGQPPRPQDKGTISAHATAFILYADNFTIGACLRLGVGGAPLRQLSAMEQQVISGHFHRIPLGFALDAPPPYISRLALAPRLASSTPRYGS